METDVQKDEDKTKGQLIGDLAEMRRRAREAEEALHCRTAELRQSREEFQAFAYIISHDLRNPLINLKGFAAELRYALEAVQSAIDVALPHLDEKRGLAVTRALHEDIPEALGFIESSVTDIDSFMNAVLKLSRLSRRDLRFEPIDMEALVRETLTSLSEAIEQRQVRVTVGPLPEIVADRAAMKEVADGILENAVLYLLPDRPGEIEISAERGPDETVVCVRDNGRGIASEDMHKVFEPFRRAGRQDVPGEGMSLPCVKILLQRHGGRIWCESELGVGTTLIFTISNHLVKGEGHVL